MADVTQGPREMVAKLRVYQRAAWNQFLETSSPSSLRVHNACKEAADALEDVITVCEPPKENTNG